MSNERESIMFNYQDVTRQKNQVLARVFGWMGMAMFVSATVAYFTAFTQTGLRLLHSPLSIVAILAQFGLVLLLSMRVHRMEPATAVMTFFGYAALSGFSLSTVLLVYKLASIAFVLAVTAGMFVAMSVYGWVTREDLSSLRSFLMMGLFGLIATMFINMFWQNSDFNLVISGFGVIIFTLLTAYDVQQIKLLSEHMLLEGHNRTHVAVIGALKLYLDFVNLFLFLLQLLGNRRR